MLSIHRTHASGFRQSPIGSLSSDDSDGSENGKKNKKKNSRFRLTKQTTLHVHHPFLYVVWNNVPNFTFCRGLEHKTTIFFSWTLIQSFRIQLRRNLPTFDELNVRDGISAIKFQAARINNFLRDVFVAVAVVVASAPYYVTRRRVAISYAQALPSLAIFPLRKWKSIFILSIIH